MDEAWRWYRAILRCSRHVGMHGVVIERQVAAFQHEVAARAIVRWAADPRVDASRLRRALKDALEADALTPPLSLNLKYEYLMYLRDILELRVLVGELPMPGGPIGIVRRVGRSR